MIAAAISPLPFPSFSISLSLSYISSSTEIRVGSRYEAGRRVGGVAGGVARATGSKVVSNRWRRGQQAGWPRE